MGDHTDYDHPDRPLTAQPPPVHVPGAPSVHALAKADTMGWWRDWQHARVILGQRQRFGLRKYGTILQVEDPARDPVADLVEELGDAVVYAYRAKAHRVPGMRLAYWMLLWLLQRVARRYYRHHAP